MDKEKQIKELKQKVDNLSNAVIYYGLGQLLLIVCFLMFFIFY